MSIVARSSASSAEVSDLLVIDCRAASTDLFIDFLNEVGLSDVLRTLNARLTVVCPVNHKADSVEQVRILSDPFGSSCSWVIVKNEAHSDTFKLYESSKTRRHVLDALHGREISMARLHDWLITALNEHNVPIMAALQHSGFTCSISTAAPNRARSSSLIPAQRPART